MFYRPADGPPGLAHNPFLAIVSPRPIGWISTVDRQGRANLAPYSFFNAVAARPPMVMYATTGARPDGAGRKDSVSNIRETGEFAVNIVSHDLMHAMNASAAPAPADVNEFELAGLETAPCREIAVPRVARAPCTLECRVWRLIELPGEHNTLTLGEVVGVHIDDALIVNGRLDVTRYRPLARLGYQDYAVVRELFELKRPV